MTARPRVTGPLVALGAGGAFLVAAWRVARWIVAQPLADAWAPALFWFGGGGFLVLVLIIGCCASVAARRQVEQDHRADHDGQADDAKPAPARPACPDPNCPRCRARRDAA